MAPEPPASELPHRSVPLPFLAATAILCGALVMVVEVMGSRVIGPFFGVSLFVWTALITVTLLALAAGYAFGGWLADRHGTPATLYAILFFAGLAALAVPALRAPVLKALAPAGLRTGALVSALVLFGPCLFLLGCVSPLVVRLAARRLERIGRTVGAFYALSTLGSFVGTVATGFLLIAYLGVRGIFLVTGGLLVGLAAVYFAFFRRKWAALAVAALPWLVPGDEPFTTKVTANGTRVTRVFEKQGFYADLQVLDYEGGSTRTRELVLDGLVQGGVDRDGGLPVYEYAYFVEQLAWGMRPEGRSCLVFGLGAGVIPRWFEERGAVCDVVEINPDVIAVARRFFGYEPRGEVFLADARRFLAASGRRYDYVVLDVFTGDTTPGHLLTREAAVKLAERVAPGGLLLANLIGGLGTEGRMTASIVRTFRTSFDSVRIYPAFDPQSERSGNLTLVAHEGPPIAFVAERVRGLPVHPLARERVARFLGREHELGSLGNAVLLTDDYNPIEFFDRGVKERVRREILEGTDWEALL